MQERIILHPDYRFLGQQARAMPTWDADGDHVDVVPVAAKTVAHPPSVWATSSAAFTRGDDFSDPAVASRYQRAVERTPPVSTVVY